MHRISVDRVGASVDGRALFSGASFGVNDTDRFAVVGPNGVGKSTLLRILAGVRAPDEGTVTQRRSTEVAYLPQEPTWADDAAITIVTADPRVTPHDAEAMLDTLGIDPVQNTAAMSQGQRRRVALARTLLQPADVRILDEPTNHLDVATINWLENHLRGLRSALILVTHDRYVLERLVTRMIDLDASTRSEAAQVLVHDGPYSTLLEARQRRRTHDQRVQTRAQNLLRKEVAWLTRQPKARTSKPKFRQEQAEALRAIAAQGGTDAPLDLGTGRHRLGNDVVTLDQVTVERGDTAVLSEVSLTIGPGERVGIVGPNGAGKTTLLEVLSGMLRPTTGDVRIGSTVVCGVYSQHASFAADDTHATVLEALEDVGTHIPLLSGETVPVTRLAERFGFVDRLMTTRVGDLSGGERRRLALLHLLIQAPNVLVFDEPTNDLDLDTLAALEDHLDGFTGTLIVASHDRYVLDRLTDRILAVGQGAVREVADLDQGLRAAYAAPSAPSNAAAGVQATPSATSSVNNRARQEARRRLRSLEQQVTQLDGDRERVLAAMTLAATQPETLRDLQQELAALDERRQHVEDEWFALAAAHDDVV